MKPGTLYKMPCGDNLRYLPKFNGPDNVIRKINKNEMVFILGEVTNSCCIWYKVLIDNKIGYITFG